MSGRLQHSNREKAVAMVREGMSQVEAAKQCGANANSVYLWCKAAGVTVKPRSYQLKSGEAYIVAEGKILTYFETEAAALGAVSDSTNAKPLKVRQASVDLIELPGLGTYVLGPKVQAKYVSRAEKRAEILARLTEEERAVLGV